MKKRRSDIECAYKVGYGAWTEDYRKCTNWVNEGEIYCPTHLQTLKARAVYYEEKEIMKQNKRDITN